MKKTIVLLAAIAMMTGYAFAQQPEKNTEAGQPETTEQTAPEQEGDKQEEADKQCDGNSCDKGGEQTEKAE